jgi:hypothetical protein
MKSLSKRCGLACADAGPLSPLCGGRSRRRARLTLLGFAAAFAAFTVYVAFASPPGAGGAPAAAGGGGHASWFGGVYASTAPYRSQVSSFISSLFPANTSATSAEPTGVPAGRSNGGGEVTRDASSVRVASAAGSNSSASSQSSKELGGAPINSVTGGSVPPASDLDGIGIGGKDGSGALTHGSATNGGPTSDQVDRNNGSEGGVSSTRTGGGSSGSQTSSSAGDGALVIQETSDVSNKQQASGSGASSNADAGHGSTAKVDARDAAGFLRNNSAGTGSLAKTDLSTGSSSTQEESGSAVPSSDSAAGNSTSEKAGAEVAAAEASNGSAGSGSDSKASLTKDSDSQTGSGNGDASNKSAGSSSSANRDGIVESNNSSASMVPWSSQAGSVVVAGEKDAGSPSKNHTFEASPALKNQEQKSGEATSGGSGRSTVSNQKGAAPQVSSGSAQSITSKPGTGNNNDVSGTSATEASDSSGNKKVDWFSETASCDMFHGSWVRDDSYPLYPEGSCPHIDEPFDCYLNGRRDLAYQKLRWQPSGCNIPR